MCVAYTAISLRKSADRGECHLRGGRSPSAQHELHARLPGRVAAFHGQVCAG